MSLRDEIVAKVLALPIDDRLYVAEVLDQSLAPPNYQTEAEWLEEIDRRIAAYDRGEVKGEDVEVFLERIRQQLALKRSNS